jgi:hypothetical protein
LRLEHLGQTSHLEAHIWARQGVSAEMHTFLSFWTIGEK